MKDLMTFSIDNFEVMSNDDSLMIGRAYIVSDGDNAHGVGISKESMEKALPTLSNKPMLAIFENGDFNDHAKTEEDEIKRTQFGTVPETNMAEIVERDGLNWLTSNFVVWKRYEPEIAERLENDPEAELSMEISINETSESNGKTNLDDWAFEGIMLLGNGVRPAIKDAGVEIFKFSATEEEEERLEESLMLYAEELNKDFSIPEKYEHINFKPTQQMAKNAQRGLDMRDSQPKSNKCCTSVGLKRANQLIKREELSPSVVKRMKSFFDRHEVDKESDSWKEGNSKAEQAWLVWGGDAGYSWAKKVVKQMEKADEKDFAVDAGSGEALEVALTKEDADFDTDWGSVDKTELRNKIMEASNYKSLVKKAYLVVEDGWEDAPSEHLKYPIVMVKDGKVVYSAKGAQSALSFLEKESEASYYKSAKSKLKKVYNKLGLGTENFAKEEFSLNYQDIMAMMSDAIREKSKDQYGYPTMYVDGCDSEYVYACNYADGKMYKMPYAQEGELYVPNFEEMKQVFKVSKYLDMSEESEDMYVVEVMGKEVYSKLVEEKQEYIEKVEEFSGIADELKTAQETIAELESYKQEKINAEKESKADALFSKYDALIAEDEIKDLKENKLFSMDFEDFAKEVSALVLPRLEAKLSEYSAEEVDDKKDDALEFNFSKKIEDEEQENTKVKKNVLDRILES